ncbi:MAG: protein translocase SEC61 complex subunit gamma [Candidatus Diapherotrites archaeon]|nr:protein translocase SEC61 complex subunit gamma [Candidatus Diapherotrites archaeon]
MQLKIGSMLRGFFDSSKRVLIIAKKPTWQEFQVMAKVTGIGIIIIGAIAYVVYLIFAFSGIGGA